MVFRELSKKAAAGLPFLHSARITYVCAAGDDEENVWSQTEDFSLSAKTTRAACRNIKRRGRTSGLVEMAPYASPRHLACHPERSEGSCPASQATARRDRWLDRQRRATLAVI